MLLLSEFADVIGQTWASDYSGPKPAQGDTQKDTSRLQKEHSMVFVITSLLANVDGKKPNGNFGNDQGRFMFNDFRLVWLMLTFHAYWIS